MRARLEKYMSFKELNNNKMNNIKRRVEHPQEELNNTTKKLNINKKSQITTKEQLNNTTTKTKQRQKKF